MIPRRFGPPHRSPVTAPEPSRPAGRRGRERGAPAVLRTESGSPLSYGCPMTNIGDDRHPGPGQDPTPDSEIDFDDERAEEFPEPDELENEEVGAVLDDPESLTTDEDEVR